MCFSILLLPFSKKYFYSWNHKIAGFWVTTLSLWNRLFVNYHITGTLPPKNKNIFVFCNHQFMLDVLVIQKIATDFGIKGELKFFSKKSLGYLPFFGWSMMLLGFILLKRSWAEDKEATLKAFSNIRQNDFKFWLASFPEGTRITKSKWEKSKTLAQKKGRKPLQHLIFPRTRGFTESMYQLRNRLELICDMTIAYPKKPVRVLYMLAGYTQEVHVNIQIHEKVNMEKVEAKEWLEERFVQKDKLLQFFKENGHFPEKEKSSI